MTPIVSAPGNVNLAAVHQSTSVKLRVSVKFDAANVKPEVPYTLADWEG